MGVNALFAIGAGAATLAWIGLLLGVVVAALVVALFNRTIRPALEISRYAEVILEAGVGIAKGLDGVVELERTRQLTLALHGPATAYLGGREAEGDARPSTPLAPREGDARPSTPLAPPGPGSLR